MFQSFDCYSQNIETDSIEVSKIASDFFEWYISSALNHKTDEYNPVEIESENGMTTLDFSNYFKNLERLSFSDSLILKEKESYSECVLKLSKVKYSDYLKLTDLDQFENLNDDFTNYYRWTGGQEMFDFYSVKNVKFNNDNAIVNGSLYFDNSGVEKRDFDRMISMRLIKKNGALSK
jgi:hypothetical protein